MKEAIVKHHSRLKPFRNTHNLKSIFLIAIVLFALIGLINAVPMDAGAEWEYENFEDNISVDFRPKVPRNLEPVNITIIAKSLQNLQGANLHYNYSVFGSGAAGGIVFRDIPENPYALFAVIPGYPGSTIVHFYIEAWNDQIEIIQSQTYRYTVERNNSWQYADFDDNIDLTFTPSTPGPNDNVTVTVKSSSTEVPIERVDVFFMLKPEGLSEQGPYSPFVNKLDSFTWEANINGYPANTDISFWVVAYDKYSTPIISQKFNYTVKELDPGIIIYEAKLWILIADKTGEAIQDVSVHIRNTSWSEDFTTDENGLLLSPYLQNGHYIVTISYLSLRDSKSIDIPNDENNYTVSFVLDKAQLLSEKHGIQSFPKWYVWAGFAAVLFFIPLMYMTQREHRREMMSQKRADKIYSRMENQHEEHMWAPLLAPFKPITKLFEDEPKRIGLSQFIAFFVLGLAGATWAPFYPWWLIMILGFATASISYRFPFLALIVLSLFVMASTGYQSPEFGFIFTIFALIILICAFFNWKFGYLVLLTVFLARLGIMIFVPITAALLYSLFLGLSVMIVSGLFLTFFITCGNLYNLSFLIGPPHKSAFIIFNKAAPSNFIPVHFVDALRGLNSPNLDLMNTIFRSNYNTMVPIVQIVLWTLMIYFIFYITSKFANKKFEQYLSFLMLPLALLPISSLSALAYFDYKLTAELAVLSLALIGIGLVGVLTSFTIQDIYPSLFKKEIERDIIGTRISQLMTLRRTSFKHVGGLKEIKRELRNAITVPLLRPKLSRLYGVNPPKGVMLFGPPGCGKTLMMRALATELNVEMIGVKCSDIMSKWYGESEEMTSRMFTIAKSRSPCILFLDEIDAVAKRRSFYSTDDVTPRLLSIMLNELDGMDESAGIMVVGATNMPELIDPALLRPGRFDKIIYIPPPEFEARKEIFKLFLRNKPLASGVNYFELAGSTEGFSGADIENVVKEASMRAMMRTLDSHRRAFITMDDFREILRQIKPSISKKMQKEYEKLGFDYSRATETAQKKKSRKKGRIFKAEKEEDEDESEDDKTSIEMGESDISWEGDEEEADEDEKAADEEPQVWDKYAPPKKKGGDMPKRKGVIKRDEDVVFEPVESSDEEEEEFVLEEDEVETESDEAPSKRKSKGAYQPVWNDNDKDESESSEDFWM